LLSASAVRVRTIEPTRLLQDRARLCHVLRFEHGIHCATPGIFRKNSDNLKHGLNERIPVRSFCESLDHIYTLAVELGDQAVGENVSARRRPNRRGRNGE
jgi:hypothetical protein